MNQRLPLTDEDGEVRELTAEDFALARPLAEVMPPEFVEMVLKHQAEQAALGRVPYPEGYEPTEKPRTQTVTLPLSTEVITAFKASGKGWQKRIDNVLLDYLHKLQNS